MLLGGSWSEELDGGNPLVDRSCLLHTARRALFAQSLLDIFGEEGSYFSLFLVPLTHIRQSIQLLYVRTRSILSPVLTLRSRYDS